MPIRPVSSSPHGNGEVKRSTGAAIAAKVATNRGERPAAYRAAVLGMKVLSNDQELQAAIHYQLAAHRRVEAPSGPSATTVLASLQHRQRRLLDLCLDDKIKADTFDGEHRHLTAQIKTLQDEAEGFERDQKAWDEAVDKFDLVNPPSLLADLDLERIWQADTPSEQGTLVDDLVDSICLYADGITFLAVGAPPFIVGLDEVGLTQGCKPVVSEARRHRSATLHWRLSPVKF
jgi:hypothetical protein